MLSGYLTFIYFLITSGSVFFKNKKHLGIQTTSGSGFTKIFRIKDPPLVLVLGFFFFLISELKNLWQLYRRLLDWILDFFQNCSFESEPVLKLLRTMVRCWNWSLI